MPPNDDAALIAAHHARDIETLVRIYLAEADRRAEQHDVDAECFFLTQAYVWALDGGHPEAERLHARLKAHGRDA